MASTEPVIVPHPNTIRGPIESVYNGRRDAIEKQYIADKVDLEADYHAALAANQSDKEDALAAAGLNPDGGTPDDYGVALKNLTVPTITGTPEVGQVATAHPGSWTCSPTLAYKWQRADDANGTNVADIAGETEATYELAEADNGKFVRTVVTASDASVASVSANSAYLSVGKDPVNTVAPEITGTTTVGEVLTSDGGTWTGTPTPVITHQWQRADDADGTNVANIAAATDETYTLVVADEGKFLRVRETGTNAHGQVTADSEYTAAIAASGPS